MLNLLSFAMTIGNYVLLSLGLYTIAKRRGINKPWLAWVPVANLWLLGCISDQYRHVAHGQVKNKRKSMLILMIVMLVLTVIVSCLAISMVLDVLPYLPDELLDWREWQRMSTMDDTELQNYLMDTLESVGEPPELMASSILVKAMITVVLSLGIVGVAIALTIQEYMAYYDVFASTDPKNATMYLVLGIIANMMGLSILMAVFVFISREKDIGMPPRGGQIIDAASAWIPPQQM